MGVWDKFKRIMDGTSEYDEIETEENDIPFNDGRSEREPRSESRYEQRSAVPQPDPMNVEPIKRGNKVVNINATAQLQVVLVKPERFDDASAVADHLNAKRTVVLNLESANKDIARRILDFLSGVAYANDGQIKKVANCTFIITPYNVGIMGDLLDELENNGLYF